MNPVTLLGKALSDLTRLRILAVLREGELCVCEITDALAMSQSTLSNHLQLLRQAELTVTRRDAKWVYYRLEPKAAPLLDAIFQHYRPVLDADPQIPHDRERLQNRLQLRVNGCCVVGFVPLESLTKGGETP